MEETAVKAGAEGRAAEGKTAIRSPIVSVMGHVDHGKSTLLDTLRGTNIVKTEAGAITQAIGASFIPIETIKSNCAALLEKMQLNFTIPGLLFIDTPGHAAFTALRKRGGNLADIAVVVIDINEGMMPQTRESIDILKNLKTPFVIALNKIDLVPGYRKMSGSLLEDLQMQSPEVAGYIEKKLYILVGELYETFQVQAERFDRCDFTKQIAIVPCSAISNQGLAELLVTLAGLAQKYLEQGLKLNAEGQGKGTVLEVKNVKGMGDCLDIILYDGMLLAGDTIVIGGMDGAIESKVKGIFVPEELQEIRDRKARFSSIKQITAAAAARIIVSDNADKIVAGMPLLTTSKESLESAKEEVQKEIEEVTLQTAKDGILVKADTIGSLEAMIVLLKEAKIPIRKATVGDITKKDVLDAESNYDKNQFFAVIMGFNVRDQSESGSGRIKIFTSDVIYRLIEDYIGWKNAQERIKIESELEDVVRPCRLEVLKNCIFRASNPAVVGIEVQAGQLKPNTPIMKKDGESFSVIKSLQREKENVQMAKKGDQLAVSIPNATCGRNLFEEDILYSQIPEEHFRKLKKFLSSLPPDEVSVLKEIAEIMRKKNPVWGV